MSKNTKYYEKRRTYKAVVRDYMCRLRAKNEGIAIAGRTLGLNALMRA